MKKLLLGTIFLGLVIVVPIPATAGVNIGIGISLPPIVFSGPPDVVAVPDAPDVYVAPDVDVELFFWNGWWWRPWEGGWYRSRYYDRDWAYYDQVPSFYFDIDPGWRRCLGERDWCGHRWDYKRIPYGEFNRNWKSWRDNRYWEKNRGWDVQKYHPRSQPEREELRHQREEQYNRRPDVQRHQQSHGQGQEHHGESEHR